MSSSEPTICVVGSSNIDLLSKVPRLPKLGETLFGHSFHFGFGGKGANQAVMAARLGAQVSMVTKLGRDMYGDSTLENYRERGIDVSHVLFDDDAHSGVAPIFVDDHGRNMIVVIPGANSLLTPTDVHEAKESIQSASVLICQLEIPLETTTVAFQIAKEGSVTTVLNPAPARPLPASLLSLTDYLVPNETEMEILGGNVAETPEQARVEYDSLQKDLGFTGELVLTLGSKGALVIDSQSEGRVPAFEVEPVDSTGAGDAFVGTLAYFLAQEEDVLLAAQRASIAAALCVTKVGTQVSFPSREEAAAAFAEAGLSPHAAA